MSCGTDTVVSIHSLRFHCANSANNKATASATVAFGLIGKLMSSLSHPP